MIQMTFYLSDKVQILFKFWKVSSVGGLVGSLVAVLILSILYECFKSYFAYKLASSEVQYVETQPVVGENRQMLPGRTIPQQVKFTIMHMATLLLGYFVMLMAMTCNGWVFMVIVSGCGVGYCITAPLLERSLYSIPRNESAVRLLSFEHTPRQRTIPQAV